MGMFYPRLDESARRNYSVPLPTADHWRSGSCEGIMGRRFACLGRMPASRSASSGEDRSHAGRRRVPSRTFLGDPAGQSVRALLDTLDLRTTQRRDMTFPPAWVAISHRAVKESKNSDVGMRVFNSMRFRGSNSEHSSGIVAGDRNITAFTHFTGSGSSPFDGHRRKILGRVV